jgi:AcrR family transcriptional regulator
MPPEERKRCIVEATLPLLTQHGRAVTTRQIAEAAGVAEGTIFRVFDSKEALVDAALARAFEPGQFVHEIGEIDTGLPFRERMVALAALLQRRFTEIFGLMRAVGLVAPPEHLDASEERDEWRRRARDQMIELIGPDAAHLTVEPEQFVHILRLLTFSASHEEIADHRLLTPDQIVDVVLYGTLGKDT